MIKTLLQQLEDWFADHDYLAVERTLGGLPVDKFTAISKNQSFYMENDAVVLIYNKGEGTDFANGEVFIPFMLRDLVEILK